MNRPDQRCFMLPASLDPVDLYQIAGCAKFKVDNWLCTYQTARLEPTLCVGSHRNQRFQRMHRLRMASQRS